MLDGDSNSVVCACGCGVSFPIRDARGRVRQFAWGHNASKGRVEIVRGRTYYHDRTHPRANSTGRVLRSWVAVEAALGRPVAPGEDVHHRDGDRGNDAPDNLCVLPHGEHASLHHLQRREQRKEK